MNRLLDWLIARKPWQLIIIMFAMAIFLALAFTNYSRGTGFLSP